MKVHLGKTLYEGSVVAPPSKSFSHRYLVTGALSEGSRISQVGESNDISATLACLSAFGSSFIRTGNTVTFGEMGEGNPIFPCDESGTTLRFLVPLAATKFPEAHFFGSQRLISRGIDEYRHCLKSVRFQMKENEIITHGKLVPGNYEIHGDQSSQYISGMLLALPLLDGDSKLRIVGPLASEPYVRMTLQAMEAFGVRVQRTPTSFLISGNQKYRAVSATVEGDFSNSAFLEAMNFLGGDVRISGLREFSSQGDKAYREIFPLLERETTMIDITNCIDLGPVLFVFAALNHGAVFTGTDRLKIKEADRASEMAEELEKAGVEVSLGQNYVGIGRYQGKEHLSFDGHNDHRIAMALSLFSTKTDVSISGAECVSKSFPDYWEVLERLGGEVTYEE